MVELKNPKVLATVREGETTWEPKLLPHLEEAIVQLEAYLRKEKDQKKQMWLREILESMRKVYWDIDEK